MAHTVADVAGPPAEQAPEKDMASTAHFRGVDVTEQGRE
jgi:hypothetical protein